MVQDPDMEAKARPVLERHRARISAVEQDPNRRMSVRTKASIRQAEALLAREGKRLERKRNYWESRTGSESAAPADKAYDDVSPPPAAAAPPAAPSRDELAAFADEDLPSSAEEAAFEIISFSNESEQQAEAPQPEALSDDDMLSMFLPPEDV